MVVLVGSGHVAYGVGIALQVRQWYDGRVATVIPVPVATATGKAIPQVRASYADFVWGLPADTETIFPRLGISTRTGAGTAQREIILVEKDSVAARAGFQPKDVLVSMDGQPIADRETFNRLMAGKQWGDGATFVVKRGEEEVTLTALFRRQK
jgi:serine protease Do